MVKRLCHQLMSVSSGLTAFHSSVPLPSFTFHFHVFPEMRQGRKGTQQVLLTEPSFCVLLTPPKSRLVLLTLSLVENTSMKPS